MKRILIIAYYFPPMGGSGVQRPAKFAKYLKREGFEPVVLAPDAPRYHIQDSTLAAELDREGVNVIRVKGRTPLDLPIPAPLLRRYRSFALWLFNRITQWLFIPDNKKGWAAPALAAAEREHARQPFELVLVTGAPFSSFLAAEQLKRRYALPVVMDMRDDWLDSVFIRYPTPLHRWLTARLERRVLRMADAIVTVNEGIAQAVRSRLGEACPPLHVIPNGFDPEDFEGLALGGATAPSPSGQPASVASAAHVDDSERANPSQGRARQIHLLHNGLFYGLQQPDALLEGVAYLLQHQPERRGAIRLIFQGDFTRAHHEKARSLAIADLVEARGTLPHRDSIRGLVEADVLWFCVGKHRDGQAHTPGKLFEYMAAGKPILGIIQAGVASDWLNRYGPGFTADPDDPKSVARSIEKLLDALEQGMLPPVAGDVVSQLDRSRQTRRLIEVFKSAGTLLL